MDAAPAVSVVMVFHRLNPFMAESINSVINQTFRDWELILVDNGTGLGPEALGAGVRDPRVRFVRLACNEGIPGGHNAGVAAARGGFIALQDYDDVAQPRRLELQAAALRADADVGLVSALAEQIDEANRPLPGYVFCLPAAAQHWAYALYAPPVITPVAMARREVLQALPYRAEFPFAADIDLQSRVVERWKMMVLPEVLLRYRCYAAQTTQQRSASIEQSRAVIQLITARRRAGRPEELASAIRAAEAGTAAECWRRTSALCCAEGFAALAAYQARRSLVLERTIKSTVTAVRLLMAARRGHSRDEQRQATRMFFRGPVRALGLRPA